MSTIDRLSTLALSGVGVIFALAFAFSMNTEDAWQLSFQLSICVLLTALLFVGWLRATRHAIQREGSVLQPMRQADSSISR
ncbi:hypothetical protein KB879_36460 (plasmid) [Cupriavidus sp. KK10]|jgi:hypothetical protein|uniref:hypothetical protein n=1 Tax=Cupriavidus sp. KK10 TaxID=1478019 RepID=UPI001BAB88D8|nr:hypothetical protein [Cupriavidus sp. KK10]QUN31826.1 hypothetical protein KB879_36460 [Cupriavidus sp. KK10]